MNRRIIASLLVIGVVGATAAGTTFALFSDTETSSGNTFAAGEIDLRVDWNESYNGEFVEEQELTDNPGAIFNLTDVKPGDEGEATVSLHVGSNPAYVTLNSTQTANLENGCTEPEAEVDQTCADPGQGEGELGNFLRFIIWNDDGDNVRQEDEEVIFNGTAEQLDGDSVLLDGNPDTEQIEPLPAESVSYLGVAWNVPRSVGNVIQTDSKRFNFSFYAEQARHNNITDGTNGNGTNGGTPGGGEVNATLAYWQTDLIQGEPIENLSEQLYSDPGVPYIEWASHGRYNGSQHVFEDADALVNDEIACIDNVQDPEISGNTVTQEFEVVSTSDCDNVTLVSYAKDHSGFDASQAGEQTIVDTDEMDFNSTGNASLSVTVPQTLPPGYVSIN